MLNHPLYITCYDLSPPFPLYRALTEKIVAVLPRMKCPHRLEPHQIQGLDFIHIYPAIQVVHLLASEAQLPVTKLMLPRLQMYSC